MLTNYVYKLCPNQGQSARMDNWVNMLRSHYNWCLGDRLTAYESHFMEGTYSDIRTKTERSPVSCCVSKYGATGNPWQTYKSKLRGAGEIQMAELPELKRNRPWYADIDSTVLQENIKRLDLAYKNFFNGRGFPTFKNRSNFSSFTYAIGVKFKGNRLYFPKLGTMRLHLSREIPTGFNIKAATVRKRQDGWYVSIRIEDKTVPEPVVKPLGEIKTVLGCDMGLTKLVHLSDGEQVENPRFNTNTHTRHLLKIRQRRLSRKPKGSNNQKKAAVLIGKFHKKIADKRSAYQWKVATLITRRNVDAIAVEDLNVSGMMRRCQVKKCDKKEGNYLSNGQSRKKGLNRAIADAGWSDLMSKIEYLAAKSGKTLIKVNPKHTSQECRNCGHIDKANRDGERFICVECGFIEHADIGAAKTVRARAIELTKSTEGLSETRGKTSKRPKKSKEKSPRFLGESGEPGNCEPLKSRIEATDIKIEPNSWSLESQSL